MEEATNEVHNGLPVVRVPGASTQEKLAVAYHALHSLADIEENSRETLEYMKQEAAKEYQITMSTGGKTSKELFARRNGIARSLWMTNTKTCIAQTFPMESD